MSGWSSPTGTGINVVVGVAAVVSAVVLWGMWGPIGGMVAWFAGWVTVALVTIGFAIIRTKVVNR